LVIYNLLTPPTRVRLSKTLHI